MAKHSPVVGRYVTIEVDGCEYKVFYLRNGQGQPLVCQHAAGCHNHQWRDLLEDPEIAANYDVIAYDLPRHGKSDPPPNREWWKEEYRLTTDHYLHFILALCDALELEDPIFIDSSFGGSVALHLALNHPDRFRAVVPVGTAEQAPAFLLDWWRHPHVNAGQVCASGVWDLMAPLSPKKDRWLTWHYYTQGSEVFKGDLYCSVDHDLTGKLGGINTQRCPVIIMTGSYDYLTPPEAAENTAKQIPGGIYVEMEDLGHFPMSENYPLFASYLKEALRLIEERT